MSAICFREETFLVEDVEQGCGRQAEVNGLIARTRDEWGLQFVASLLVYGALMTWAIAWLESIPVPVYFISLVVLVVASALTASAFRGSRYYNKHYGMIEDRY